MRKNNNKLFNVVSVMGLTALILGVAAVPAFAANGDYYDTKTKIHYSVSGMSDVMRADLEQAYANGNTFVKELNGGKFLNYNAARIAIENAIIAHRPIDGSFLAELGAENIDSTFDASVYTEYKVDFEVISIS